MTVHFPDGSQQGIDLSYPWHYPSESADPFVRGNDNVPATFQFPPADHSMNESPLVRYVVAHTTPDGFTTLRNCPT